MWTGRTFCGSHGTETVWATVGTNIGDLGGSKWVNRTMYTIGGAESGTEVDNDSEGTEAFCEEDNTQMVTEGRRHGVSHRHSVVLQYKHIEAEATVLNQRKYMSVDVNSRVCL